MWDFTTQPKKGKGCGPSGGEAARTAVVLGWGKLVGREEREGGWALREGTTGQDSWGEAQPLPRWTHPNREGGSRGGG